MRAAGFACAMAAVLMLGEVRPAEGLEVDPYLAWLADIPDSTSALNAYTNAMVSGHLQKLEESSSPGECLEVAIGLMRRFHQSVVGRRRAIHFIKTSQSIEGWKGGGPWSSVWRSYYRRLPFLYVSSLARTIEVNGVRLSIDKIGHFFSYGRRYYKRYLRAIATGLPAPEAEVAAIRYGMRQENLFVSKWIDSIFSHADLEANYQGLRFARDLCEGAEPLLRRVEGAWSLERDVDWCNYVTPAFDEGYNGNHFTRLGWWLVRPRLELHCGLLTEPKVVERLEYYRSFESPSRSQLTIREVFASRGKDPQTRHSIQTLCVAPASD